MSGREFSGGKFTLNRGRIELAPLICCMTVTSSDSTIFSLISNPNEQ